MALSATFTVNGNANPATHEVAYGGAFSLALQSITGVNSIQWEVLSTSHPDDVAPTLVLSGVPVGQIATGTFRSNPSDGQGRAILVRCTVRDSSGGIDRQSAIIGVPNTVAGIVPLCPGESTERDATHGWAPVFNEAISLAGSGSSSEVSQNAKVACRAATTAPLPANTRTGNVLTANAAGALASQDGVTLAVNDRFLVKDEASTLKNGPYTVTAVGSGAAPWVLTRATDADSNAEVVSGISVAVTSGAVNGGRIFLLTTPAPIVLNTTGLTWESTASDSVGGGAVAEPVFVVATSNITLSGSQTIDGQLVVAGRRVLAPAQTTGADRDIWISAAGAWSRSTDTLFPGLAVKITGGTVYGGGEAQLRTAAPIVRGTTSLLWDVHSAVAVVPVTDRGKVLQVNTSTDAAELAFIGDSNVPNGALSPVKISPAGGVDGQFLGRVGGVLTFANPPAGGGGGATEVLSAADTALPTQPIGGQGAIVFRSRNGRSVAGQRDIVDISEYGGKPTISNTTIRATVAAASTTVALNSAVELANGDYICLLAAGPMHGLATPAAPTCTVKNPQGSLVTTRQYSLVAWSEGNGTSAASPITTVLNCPADSEIGDVGDPLIEVRPTGAIPSNVAKYAVYHRRETSPGAGTYTAWECIGGISPNPITLHPDLYISFMHIQNPGGNREMNPFINGTYANSTLPATAVPDMLHTRVVSGAGTTTITIADPAAHAISNLYLGRSLKVPWENALAEGNRISFGPGTWDIHHDIVMQTQRDARIFGAGKELTSLRFWYGKGMELHSTNAIYRDFEVTQRGVVLPAGRFICLPYDGSLNSDYLYHGAAIYIRTECTLERVRVTAVYGSGIVFRGATAESDNANRVILWHCDVSSNFGHGIVASGYDGNAGRIYYADVVGSYGIGLLDSSFLGCNWVDCHVSGNRLQAAKSVQNTASAKFDGIYTEGGSNMAIAVNGGGDAYCGTWGAGIDVTMFGASAGFWRSGHTSNWLLVSSGLPRARPWEPYSGEAKDNLRPQDRRQPTIYNGFAYEIDASQEFSPGVFLTGSRSPCPYGTTEPVWPTVEGATVADGDVRWKAYSAGPEAHYRIDPYHSYRALDNSNQKPLNHHELWNAADRKLVFYYDDNTIGDSMWWWGGTNTSFPEACGLHHFPSGFGTGSSSATYRRVDFKMGAPSYQAGYRSGELYFDTHQSARTLARKATAFFSQGATTRTNSTAYVFGRIVRPTPDNGRTYILADITGDASFGGTTAASQPVAFSSPTALGAFITDGECVWKDVGPDISAITSPWSTVPLTRSASATLDFPSIPAHSTAELSVTVTGAAAGDRASATPRNGIEAGLMWSAYVSGSNTVRVRLANVTASAIDPASREWVATFDTV